MDSKRRKKHTENNWKHTENNWTWTKQTLYMGESIRDWVECKDAKTRKETMLRAAASWKTMAEWGQDKFKSIKGELEGINDSKVIKN